MCACNILQVFYNSNAFHTRNGDMDIRFTYAIELSRSAILRMSNLQGQLKAVGTVSMSIELSCLLLTREHQSFEVK